MKMRKSEFQLALKGFEKKTVKGFVSDSFGIHKLESGWYNITHLRTGGRIGPHIEKQKQAKDIVERLEMLAVPWDKPKEELIEYYPSVQEVFSCVLPE